VELQNTNADFQIFHTVYCEQLKIVYVEFQLFQQNSQFWDKFWKDLICFLSVELKMLVKEGVTGVSRTPYEI